MEVFKNYVIGLDYKATKVLGLKKTLINIFKQYCYNLYVASVCGLF
jgi:hypothetical protein